VKNAIRQLITKHMSKNQGGVRSLELPSIARGLSQLPLHDLVGVAVAAVKIPGKGIFVTEELLQLLPAQEELLT
jgi:hypothetical protein